MIIEHLCLICNDALGPAGRGCSLLLATAPSGGRLGAFSMSTCIRTPLSSTGLFKSEKLANTSSGSPKTRRTSSTTVDSEHTFYYPVMASMLPFPHSFSSLFGAITIRVGYGIDVDEHKDTDYLGIAQRAMETFSLAFLPGKYLVEAFPILRYLPSFMPGAGFKREAAEWYPIVRRMRDVPWEAAMTALVSSNKKYASA